MSPIFHPNIMSGVDNGHLLKSNHVEIKNPGKILKTPFTSMHGYTLIVQ